MDISEREMMPEEELDRRIAGERMYERAEEALGIFGINILRSPEVIRSFSAVLN